ncbi:MAG: ROK family protein [Chitinophagaceae bacterium]|nr:ROK family protein [Chitinophagaceae bacterium]
MSSHLKNIKNYVAGIDIGGSHITTGIVDLNKGGLLDDFIVRKRVDSKAPAEEIFSAWCMAIQELWQHYGVSSCRLGFAMPGPFNYATGVSLIKGFDKFEALYQMNIREELARCLSIDKEDLRFRNDAEAFLEGEVYGGAAKGYTHAAGVTLGTGFGSAFSHNGQTGDAELSVTQYKGEKIEEFVSTRGIVRRYKELTGRSIRDAREAAELYHSDPDAAAAFNIFAIDLTWILKILIENEQPEIVVIGGSIAHSWELFMKTVIGNISEAMPDAPKIVKAALAENAALVGGAFCFKK